MKSRKLGMLIFLILISLISIGFTKSYSLSIGLGYFPNGKWRTSTPEEQGMNSNKLNAMHDKIINEGLGVDCVLIVRNGYLVFEEYFDYYNFTNLHNTWSVTKSIIGLLVGIANESGIIPNLDEPILEIFNDYTFTNVDARKEAITIRHLLKMQMGIEWRLETYGVIDPFDYTFHSNMSDEKLETFPVDEDNDFFRMINSDDWVQYILDKPMINDPGEVFVYNDGAIHLLSAIIKRKAGINTVDFTKQFLFSPLNISDYHWYNDSQGITVGSHGLWLHPLDMVKIGYLCLNNGTWNNTQVVPEEWIPQPTAEDGYLWWKNTDFNYYRAFGLANQQILVKPDSNLVCVMTASDYNSNAPGLLIFSHVLQSFLLESTTSDMDTVLTSFTSDEDATTDETTSTLTKDSTSIYIFSVIGFILCIPILRKKKK